MKNSVDHKNPFISVIIPVYNVKEYLAHCIYSVLMQTYDNYEVILVDDGSTDGSGRICDDFALMNKNIHTYHKENGGLSDARNFGLEQSRGEYIIFVDSDDYVSEDYVESLVHLRESYDADIAVAQLILYRGDDYRFNKNVGEAQCLSTEEALIKMMYRMDFNVSAVAKLYKRSILRNHPYPVGVLYEDLATSYKVFADCKTVAYSNKVIYCYRLRKGSITHQAIDQKHLFGIKAAVQELKYMEQYFPNAVNAARYSVVHTVIGLIDNIFYETPQKYALFCYLRNILKPYVALILRDRNVKMTRKVRCIIIMLGYVPTLLFVKIIYLLNKYREHKFQ